MGENSHIEWCDHTFNPWIGCTKVSPGCVNCYAEARDLRWNAAAAAVHPAAIGTEWERHSRPRVFCASLADWLDDEVPIEWLADLLLLILATPNLDWLLLSKRPQNWKSRLTKTLPLFKQWGVSAGGPVRNWLSGVYTPPANVWLGTTVEDQTRADERIPALLAIPARVRFLSCEPLLGPVDLRLLGILQDASEGSPSLHWVICGGESGPNARPMHPAWARSLRDQCAAAGVPFHFKQWGEWLGYSQSRVAGVSTNTMQAAPFDCVGEPSILLCRIGKTRAGRLLDGREHSEFPVSLHNPEILS